MISLYGINKQIEEAMEQSFIVDEETGEVIFQKDALDKLEGEFSDKVDNIVCYIKDLDVLTDAIKNEKKALEERLASTQSRIDSLKKYVSNSLEMRNMNKYETAKHKLSFRTSKSVDVVDEESVESNYWKVEEVKKLDKKAILDDLKQGIEVKGCKLLEKNNLQIK